MRNPNQFRQLFLRHEINIAQQNACKTRFIVPNIYCYIRFDVFLLTRGWKVKPSGVCTAHGTTEKT